MNAMKVSLFSLLLSTITISTSALAADITSRDTSVQKLTDPEIASIVVAANKVDIEAGTFAAAHSKNAKVQAFAQTMERDHTSVNKQAVDLVTKLNVQPKENEVSRKLTSDGEKTLTRLRGLHGTEFDKAYIDNEVAYHETVIDMVKTRLIPEATNSELRELLVKVSPTFVEHLNHAKALQSELQKAG